MAGALNMANCLDQPLIGGIEKLEESVLLLTISEVKSPMGIGIGELSCCTSLEANPRVSDYLPFFWTDRRYGEIPSYRKGPIF